MYEFLVMRCVDMEKVDFIVVVYFMDWLELFIKIECYMDEIKESNNVM